MPSRVELTERHDMRVIIIGAGLGGLTLAQLLTAAPNVRVRCYERSQTLDDRLTGFRVMLSGSTLTTLKGKLWNEVWSHIALSIGEQPEGGQRMEFMKGTGDKMFTWDSEAMRDQFSVSRHQMRMGLLHRSESFLRLGKMFEYYEELPDGTVRVFFTDGTTDECDLLVGADGFNSRIKKQMLPYVTQETKDMAVIYFKVPLTQHTMHLMETAGSVMAFCPKNQNIILGGWQNPIAPWATRYTALNIEPEESYIMLGCGSPIKEFINQRTTPDRLTPAELKAEVIARTKNNPAIHSRFAQLAELSCTNTAYMHMVKKSEAIKPWHHQNITLLGDAVFNMSNMLGKGANCALLDAVQLAELLTSKTWNIRNRYRLTKYVEENIERRSRERQRSAMMQRIVYFGGNKVKGFVRAKTLPVMLKRIDGLDRESHDANGADWVSEEGSWSYAPSGEREAWAEELNWEEIYEAEHPSSGENSRVGTSSSAAPHFKKMSGLSAHSLNSRPQRDRAGETEKRQGVVMNGRSQSGLSENDGKRDASSSDDNKSIAASSIAGSSAFPTATASSSSSVYTQCENCGHKMSSDTLRKDDASSLSGVNKVSPSHLLSRMAIQ